MSPAKMVLHKKNKSVRRRNEKPSTSGRVLKQTNSKNEVTIRVGRDYQAACPDLLPENERQPSPADRALLMWSPTENIAATKLEEYITKAEGEYSYNREQSLGMLFWHRHNLDRAMVDLANYQPIPSEWSVEERQLFEAAFQIYGKDFHKICKMLPGKSIGNLVQYYYGWKKTRCVLLNRQPTKLKACKKVRAHTEGSSGNS